MTIFALKTQMKCDFRGVKNRFYTPLNSSFIKKNSTHYSPSSTRSRIIRNICINLNLNKSIGNKILCYHLTWKVLWQWICTFGSAILEANIVCTNKLNLRLIWNFQKLSMLTNHCRQRSQCRAAWNTLQWRVARRPKPRAGRPTDLHSFLLVGLLWKTASKIFWKGFQCIIIISFEIKTMEKAQKPQICFI